MSGGFLEYEKANNRFLKLLQNDFGYRNVICGHPDIMILCPHDHSISKITFTIPDDFVQTHVARFDKNSRDSFTTMNKFHGTIKEKESEVIIDDEVFHILRVGEIQLYTSSLPLYIISSPIVYKDCEWEMCSSTPPNLEKPGGNDQKLNKKKRNKTLTLVKRKKIEKPKKTKKENPKKSKRDKPSRSPSPSLSTNGNEESPSSKKVEESEKKVEQEEKEEEKKTVEGEEEEKEVEGEKKRALISTYKDFVNTLRGVACAKVVKSIKRFVIEMRNSTQSDFPNPSEVVRKFIDGMTYAIHIHPSIGGLSEEEEEVVREGLEKYLLTKLYDRLFLPLTMEEINKDEEFRKKLNKLQGLKPENCDVEADYVLHPYWNRSIEELRRINNFHTPRDKCICVLNSVNLLFEILKAKKPSSTPKGADDFVPLLMYLVLKANPPSIYLNLQYVQLYRNPDFLNGTESGWAVTNLEAAVHFWNQIDGKTATRMLKKISNLEIEAMLRGESLIEMGEVEKMKSEENQNSNLKIDTNFVEKVGTPSSSPGSDLYLESMKQELANEGLDDFRIDEPKKKLQKPKPIGFMSFDLYDEESEKKKVEEKKIKRNIVKKMELEITESKRIVSQKDSEIEWLKNEKMRILLMLREVRDIITEKKKEEKDNIASTPKSENEINQDNIICEDYSDIDFEDLRMGDLKKIFFGYKKMFTQLNSVKGILTNRKKKKKSSIVISKEREVLVKPTGENPKDVKISENSSEEVQQKDVEKLT